MTTVHLSSESLCLVILDNEFQDNVKTLRRLEQDRNDLDARIASLKMRQMEIERLSYNIICPGRPQIVIVI